MGLLDNLKLRREALCRAHAFDRDGRGGRLYSSVEAKRIDTWYSLLIGNEIKSVYNI